MPFKNIRTRRTLCFTGVTMITKVIPVSMMGRAKIIRTILAIRTIRITEIIRIIINTKHTMAMWAIRITRTPRILCFIGSYYGCSGDYG